MTLKIGNLLVLGGGLARHRLQGVLVLSLDRCQLCIIELLHLIRVSLILLPLLVERAARQLCLALGFFGR